MQKIAELSLCGLGGFAYNSLVHVSSLKIINVDAKMMHIFDASYIQKTSKHSKTQQNTAKHSKTQHFDAFSNEKRSRTCKNSFSAVSKALMLSNGAFFTECYTLQRETNRKHGIDETNTVSAHRKPARRAPHTNNTHTSYQIPLAVREQTREYCLRYTRHFDRLALRPIEASAPQN